MISERPADIDAPSPKQSRLRRTASRPGSHCDRGPVAVRKQEQRAPAYGHRPRFTFRRATGLFCLLLLASAGLRAADNSGKTPDELIARAAAAFEKGHRAESFKLLQQAIDTWPTNAGTYFVRGRLYALDGQHVKAIADFDQVLHYNPKAALGFQYRGEEHFKLGYIRESIADFDQYLTLEPVARPQHWQRGIALYYAGRYDDGRKQFELHQTVNSSDVENAVWHFLCVARASDVVQARASLIRIEGDGRVPMMQVYALFAGKGTPENVLAAAGAGNPSSKELNQQLFFAHLYLGLYYEAMGKSELAREHIVKAAGEYKQDHFMGDVARVHAALLSKPGNRPASSGADTPTNTPR